MAMIKFLKKGLKYNGKYIPVRYSLGELINYPKGTITIYAREYGNQLPPELRPENDTDGMTDYYDKDKARITPSNKYYGEIRKLMKSGDE